MFRVFFATLILLQFPVGAFAGCCNYNCCDCSCVANHIQRADLIERLIEIKKGYGYVNKDMVVSFSSGVKQSSSELDALNDEIKPLGVMCSLVSIDEQKTISCPLN